jgi:hypothetical protein
MAKSRLLSRLLPAALAAGLVFATPVAARAQQNIVVELFTSEGCSSCPPADAILTALSRQRSKAGIELILLGEHVEYWNDQGWRDRFSAPTFTQRQYDYVRQLHLATAYTPQVVIDGHLQTSGGNASALQSMILESASSPKPASVTLKLVSPDKLQVVVTDSTDTRSVVLLAVTEDNLSTSVKAGENGGHVLEHNAVARDLHSIGTASNGTFDKVVTIPSKADWKKGDLRIAVLVQDPRSGAIRGAASVPLHAPGTPTTGR